MILSSLIEIGLLVLEKIFSNINICKNGFPHCGSTQPPGTNLNFHYIGKPLCKPLRRFSIFVVLEKNFK
jgi:hypothetical protein